MRPQCGRNREDAVKLAIALNLPLGKTTAKLRLQPLGNHLYQIGSVIGAFLSALFFFKDALTDMPIHQGAFVIDRTHRLFARPGDNRLDVVD